MCFFSCFSPVVLKAFRKKNKCDLGFFWLERPKISFLIGKKNHPHFVLDMEIIWGPLTKQKITKKSRKVMRFAPRYHFELKDEMFCLTVPMTSVSLLADVTMASQWDSSDQKPTSINLNRVCATKTPQIFNPTNGGDSNRKSIEWSLDRAFLFETMSCWKKYKLD